MTSVRIGYKFFCGTSKGGLNAMALAKRDANAPRPFGGPFLGADADRPGRSVNERPGRRALLSGATREQDDGGVPAWSSAGLVRLHQNVSQSSSDAALVAAGLRAGAAMA